MKEKKKNLIFPKWVFLLGILILAFLLRVYRISAVPPALNWDEVSHGYNAYSILKTGKDQWGIALPSIFRVYGDYKLPLYIYLTVPSVFIFGLSAFSVRLVSILSGVGLVWLAYLITKKVSQDEGVSLLASFLTALTPWSLFLSRVAVEANLGAFLFALGVYYLICWVGTPKSKSLVLAALFWGLSLHAYNSARILVPIASFLCALLIIKKKKVKAALVPGLILFLFFLPVIFQLFNKTADARFGLVSLVDQGTVNQIIEKRMASKLPKVISRVLYNRPTYFLFYSFKNYLANLAPGYLFFGGGSNYQFSLPDHELLYLIVAPFLILGFLKAIQKRGEREKILVFWLLISIIPSAVTKDAPHALRTIFVLPLPLVFSALGVKTTLDLIKEKSKLKGSLVKIVLVISILISFIRWWNDYLNLYPKNYSWSWQYGYREAVEFIKANYSKYDRIFLTKRYAEPHEFILFYFPWDPGSYQIDQKKKWDYHSDWYWVDAFDKFEFVNDWEIKVKVSCNNLKERCLLISSPGNYPIGWTTIKTINFLDGKPAFEILEK